MAISNDFELSKVLVAKDGVGTAAWGTNNALNFYDPSTAFGGGQNHGGFALMGSEALANPSFVAAQGTATAGEIIGLTLAAVPVDTDRYAIKIGDEVYYTNSGSGTTDATLATALMAATDVNGKLFSDKYNAFDVALTNYATPASDDDDEAISIQYKNAGDRGDDVKVELIKLSGTTLDGEPTGTDSISHLRHNEREGVSGRCFFFHNLPQLVLPIIFQVHNKNYILIKNIICGKLNFDLC